MKLNVAVTLVAFVYNILNVVFWFDISNMPNATSMIYIFLFPSLWVASLAIVAILAFRNRKKWFSKPYAVPTIIGIFFCTPIPFLLIKLATEPTTYLDSTSFMSKNGQTVKTEVWKYRSGTLQTIKYWTAEREQCNTCDSSMFQKDSVWVYFDKRKDTIRVERYKAGKLIGAINR